MTSVFRIQNVRQSGQVAPRFSKDLQSCRGDSYSLGEGVTASTCCRPWAASSLLGVKHRSRIPQAGSPEGSLLPGAYVWATIFSPVK